MAKNIPDEIENISLSAKQIKSKLEDSLAYDHTKYKNITILLANKTIQNAKLPFSDFKTSVSDEIYGQELLLEDIKKHVTDTKLIQENVAVEVETIIEEEEPTIDVEFVEPEVEIEEEEMHPVAPVSTYVNNHNNEVNIVDESCEFDDIIEQEDDYDFDDEEDELQYAELPYSERAKRPKGYTIKVVDVAAVIKKIKDEGRAKNAGKPVMGRRQINKLLKPYMIEQLSLDIEDSDTRLTSIDIYLNAVDKISHNPKDEKKSN